MSDLIKREDAIDAIGADIDEIDALDPSAGIKKACIRRAIWKVMGVPSTDRPQEWIPCSERMPKPYTEVLVCDECGWISLGAYRPCDVTEKDSGWSTHTRIKLPTDEVIAWMPLPKPWKGADDEV